MKQFWKYLLDQRGEVVINPGAAPESWVTPLAEPIKATSPELHSWLTKRSEPDFPTFVKSHYELEKKIGNSIVPPGPNASPDDRKAFKAKVYGTGEFKAPPESPDKYQIKRPETIPQSAWNPTYESKFRQIAHEEGLPQSTIDRLVEFDNERTGGVIEQMKIDMEAASAKFGEFAKEMRKQPQELVEMGERLITRLFQNDPEGYAYINKLNEQTGAFKHPAFVKLLTGAGLMAGEDQGIIGEVAPEVIADARRELTAIQTAGHPLHERWRTMDSKNDTEMQNKVAQLYARISGGK